METQIASTLYTPARTLSISGLSSLEITIFDLKMMAKSGLKFYFEIKFSEPLQSCYAKKSDKKAELAWQVSRYL